jgi:hypothetical protein
MDVVATVWFLSLLSGLSLAALDRCITEVARKKKIKSVNSFKIPPRKELRRSEEKSESASQEAVGA